MERLDRLQLIPLREVVVQSVAILSVQERFQDQTPDEILDLIIKQAMEVKGAYCSNCWEAGEPVQAHVGGVH